MSELDKILDGLIRQTTDGKLKWSRSVERDEFLTAVDEVSVLVRGWRSRAIQPTIVPDLYGLRILDDEGSTVVDLVTGDGSASVSSDRRATDEQARQLGRLFNLARHSALNTQATLEKLALALEA